MRMMFVALGVAVVLVVAGAVAFLAYVPRADVDYSARLSITSETDIRSVDGVTGAGTADDPYVIEGLRYLADPRWTAIEVADRSDYILFKDIVIEGAVEEWRLFPSTGSEYVGMALYGVSNCTIENCTFKSLSWAVRATSCHSLIIESCSFSGCFVGVTVQALDAFPPQNNSDISVTENRFDNCSWACGAHNFETLAFEENTLCSCRNGISASTVWYTGAEPESIDLLVRGNEANSDYISPVRMECFVHVEGCTDVTISWNHVPVRLDCFARVERSGGVSVVDNDFHVLHSGVVATDSDTLDVSRNFIAAEDYTLESGVGIWASDCANLTLTENHGIWLGVGIELIATAAGATNGEGWDNDVGLIVETDGVEFVWT